MGIAEEIFPQEEREKIANELNVIHKQAADMLIGWSNQHISVPQVSLIVNRTMEALCEIGRSTFTNSRSNPEEPLQETEMLIMEVFMVGFNLGATGKSLVQIKGMCGHEHHRAENN